MFNYNNENESDVSTDSVLIVKYENGYGVEIVSFIAEEGMVSETVLKRFVTLSLEEALNLARGYLNKGDENL